MEGFPAVQWYIHHDVNIIKLWVTKNNEDPFGLPRFVYLNYLESN